MMKEVSSAKFSRVGWPHLGQFCIRGMFSSLSSIKARLTWVVMPCQKKLATRERFNDYFLSQEDEHILLSSCRARRCKREGQ